MTIKPDEHNDDSLEHLPTPEEDEIAIEKTRQQHIHDLESRLKKLDRQFYALCLLVIIVMVAALVALVLFHASV